MSLYQHITLINNTFLITISLLVVFMPGSCIANELKEEEAVVWGYLYHGEPQVVLKNNTFDREFPEIISLAAKLIRYYIKNNQLLKSYELLQRALLFAPDNSELLALMADILYRNAQITEAEIHATKSLENDSKAALACIVLGKISLDKLGNSGDDLKKRKDLLNEALMYFKAAVRYEPWRPEAHVGLSSVYLLKNQKNKSYEELIIARELDNKNKDVLFQFANFYHKNQQYQRAIDYSYELLDLIDDFEIKYRDVHSIAAKSYYKLGHLEDARKEYFKYLKYRLNKGESSDELELITDF